MFLSDDARVHVADIRSRLQDGERSFAGGDVARLLCVVDELTERGQALHDDVQDLRRVYGPSAALQDVEQLASSVIGFGAN